MNGREALEYSHSGGRFLLGYGADFYGIWDRASVQEPVETFPRTDEGWARAWTRYTALEPHSVEVGVRAGAPAYGPPVRYFRPLGSLGAWVVGLLVVRLVAIPFETWLNLRNIDRLVSAASTAELETLSRNLAPEPGFLLLGFLGSAGAIALVVVWLVWQYRAQANLHALGTPGLRFTPGWAVGWWFIPIMNLFKPYQTVREAWTRSREAGAPDGPSSPRLIAWWLTYIVPFFAGIALVVVITSRIAATPRPDLSEVLDAVQPFRAFIIATAALNWVAALLAITIVRDITRWQGARAGATIAP